MVKLFKFLCDLGYIPKTTGITKFDLEFKNLKEVFTYMMEKEQEVTRSIHHIMGVYRQKNYYYLERFMGWFVEEQFEEEHTAKRALELCHLIGESKGDIYILDEKIGRLRKPSFTENKA